MLKYINKLKASFEFGAKFAAGQIMLGECVQLETEVRTYNVFVNEDIIQYGFFVKPSVPACGVIMVNVSLVPLFPNIQPAYVCNNAFLALDKHMQTCIMAHEEGHIVLEHHKRKKRMFGLLDNLVRIFKELPQEYEADKYAYQLLGDKYLDMFNFYKQFKGAKHLDSRIKALKGDK